MDLKLKDQQRRIKSKQYLNITDKANDLLRILESDLEACDFKWTLFVAAANNYKYDSLLKPFPCAFVSNKILQINRLRETIAIIPEFSVLSRRLHIFCDHPNFIDDCIHNKTIDLLHWCLIGDKAKEPILKNINRSNVSKIGEFI